MKNLGLNVQKIFIFGVALFLARVLVGILIGGFNVEESFGKEAIFRYAIEFGLDALVIAVVFARLGYVQEHRPYLHAFCVVILQEVLGVVLSFLLPGGVPSSPLWFVDYAVLVSSALIGVMIGRRWMLKKS